MTARFEADPDWLAFDPEPSKPSYVLPEGAVDAHCHVFGPGDVFPYAKERKYTPCDAGKEELFALRDLLGFDKNVVVQASCHGSDNSALLDALRGSKGRARGVASLAPEVSDETLAEMDEAGVRAVRFNFIRRLVDDRPESDYRKIAQRVGELGWHVVVYFEAADLASRFELLTSFETQVVVDHMGRPDTTRDVDGPEFALFLRLMSKHDNFFCKVTCPERLSVSGPPHYDDVVPFARRLVEEFPGRVLWGTDWPHPNLKDNMPDDGSLVDFIPRIATSEQARHSLLVDNPTRLYFSVRR
ncbi:MAG: amidohydrolase family protein [Acidimicrobiales bacterium]